MLYFYINENITRKHSMLVVVTRIIVTVMKVVRFTMSHFAKVIISLIKMVKLIEIQNSRLIMAIIGQIIVYQINLVVVIIPI